MGQPVYAITIKPLSVEDGGGFFAYVNDLPGCASNGETPEAALSNVIDAIDCWIATAPSSLATSDKR